MTTGTEHTCYQRPKPRQRVARIRPKAAPGALDLQDRRLGHRPSNREKIAAGSMTQPTRLLQVVRVNAGVVRTQPITGGWMFRFLTFCLKLSIYTGALLTVIAGAAIGPEIMTELGLPDISERP